MCPSSLPESASAEVWSREQEKAFENALANLLPSKAEKGDDDRWWEKLASSVPAKPLAEVRRHYEFLVEDVRAIEAGKVAFPCYVGEDKEKDQRQPPPPPPQQQQQQMPGFADRKELGGSGGGTGGGGFDSGGGHGRGGLSKAEQERRKGIPWTEEEHKLFLLGLSKFGKGDWRSISRNFVISRTPTQVASHAQKYFIRLNSMNRDRRRSSIHDITSLNGGDVASPQGPITGQNNGAVVGSPAKQPPQPNMPAMGMYGPPVGQPVPGHMVSAVGTPIMLPPPGHPPYMVPMAYPLHPPPPAMHQ